jgi:hypothetical protein
MRDPPVLSEPKANSAQVGTLMLDARNNSRYAAIAVPVNQSSSWMSALRRANLTTTFVTEHQDDGSVIHLLFSRHLPLRLVVWPLPDSFALNVTMSNDTKHVDVLVHGNNNDTSFLTSLCDNCETCEPAARAAHFNQVCCEHHTPNADPRAV